MARGFTLIEVAIVLGIFAAVAAFSLAMGIDSIARGSLKSERDTLITMLASARTAALANIDAEPHGVHIDPTNFTLFDGVSYTDDPSSYRVVERNSAITISGVSLPYDVVFAQLSARTSAVSLTLAHGAQSTTVDITQEGALEW